jgi:hypothetical protein
VGSGDGGAADGRADTGARARIHSPSESIQFLFLRVHPFSRPHYCIPWPAVPLSLQSPQLSQVMIPFSPSRCTPSCPLSLVRCVPPHSMLPTPHVSSHVTSLLVALASPPSRRAARAGGSAWAQSGGACGARGLCRGWGVQAECGPAAAPLPCTCPRLRCQGAQRLLRWCVESDLRGGGEISRPIWDRY